MMIWLIQQFISNHSAASIVIILELIILIALNRMVISNHRTEKLKRLEPYLDWMGFMVGLIPLIGLFTSLIELDAGIRAINTSGAGDPRVVSAGLAEFYLNQAILWGSFFFLLGTSFLLHMLYNKYDGELKTEAK
jgi:hypothetical protein